MSISTQSKATTSRGRRAGSALKTTKVTFVLPESLAQRVRQAVEAGAWESQNALARAAIESELKRVREAEIVRAMQDAANDPLFMADLEECMRDFAPLDSDANQYLDVEPDYPDEKLVQEPQ